VAFWVTCVVVDVYVLMVWLGVHMVARLEGCKGLKRSKQSGMWVTCV